MLHDEVHKSINVSILSWKYDVLVAHITVHCILKNNWHFVSGFTWLIPNSH